MNTFVRLLGFLRPYRRAVIAAAVLACFAMVMTVLVPALTGYAVNALQHGAKASQAHDYEKRDHYQHQLELTALAIAVAVLIRWGLTYMRRMIAGRVSLAIEYDLRERLYTRLQALELAFFDRQQTGQLMSRVTVDLQAVRFFLGYGLVFILQSAITILLAAIAMIIINPGLGAISIIPVPFVVVISQRYGRRARPAIQEVQQRIAELTANAEENIAGVRVVKSFAREPLQLERFRRSVSRVFDQSMVATRLEAVFNPIIGFLPQLGLAAVLLIGGTAVIDAKLSLGQFTTFYLYLNMLISPMRTLGVTLGLAQRATASGARVFQLLDREPQLVSPSNAPPLPPGSGQITFDHVSLAYDSSEEPELVEGAAPSASLGRLVLRDIDLTITAGTTVALVGATGSGKTSLVSLIPRLYDVSEGAVLIDGADVRSVDLRSLRSQVAVVSDDPFLFSASIAENIAYARPEASRGRDHRRGASRSGTRVHRATTRRLPHSGRRARPHGLRRPAPAPCDRPGARRRSAHPRARRCHELRRLLDGAQNQGRARRGDGRPHDADHRAPPLDDRAGRRNRRAGARRCAGARQPRRTA